MHAKPLLLLCSLLTTALATPTPSRLELRQYNGSVADLPATATIIANSNSTDCDGAYPFSNSSTSQGTTIIVPDNVCIPLNTNPNNTALSVSIVDVNPFNTTNPENTTFVGYCYFLIWEDSVCTGDSAWEFDPIYGGGSDDWTCMADIGWDDGSSVFGSIMLACYQYVVLPPPVPSVPHYGMCGGIGYTGPTVCLPPYVCTEDNEYFSQCL